MKQRSPYSVLCGCLLVGVFSVGFNRPVLAQSSPQIPPDISEKDSSSQSNQSQTQVQPQPKNKSMTFGEVFASVDKADANRRAGLKSSLLAQSMQVIPMVVIVEHSASYLDAISGWEGPVKYPILFDDGTDLARENIARFVRAFEPEDVVRLTKPGTSAWGNGAQERQAAINTALAAAIHQAEPDWTVSLGTLKSTGVISPGVVVMDPTDWHWAAGLALAAGRFEPIVYVSGPEQPYQELAPAQAQAYNHAIGQGLRKLGLSFDQIGDEVDAITLAFRLGVKIKTGPQERDRLATTDQIGREETSLGGMRWAWSGQFMGNTATTVYQAMCSLFLPIESAFIWDGYPSTGDWNRYDGTEAGKILASSGMKTEVFDEPRNSLAGFRGRGSSSPVDASLILMNTKGTQAYFDLPMAPEGSGRPGDLPMLAKPSALHMVHSFSLATPRSPRTVGGRWLEKGVYLYAGSVDEPYLSGFVPTPMVAKRLLGQMPFAAAVHYDDGQAWKITVLGDPLKTISPCGTRLASIPDQYTQVLNAQGGQWLNQRAKDSLKAGEYTEAIEDFVLTNRDEAVVRLGGALLRDKPELVDDLAAKIIVQAAFRQGEHELVLDAFERISADARQNRITQDALWLAGRYRLNRFGDSRAMALMRTNLRESQELPDAEELAKIMARDSMPAAVGFLESLRPTLKSAGQRRALDKAIARIRR